VSAVAPAHPGGAAAPDVAARLSLENLSVDLYSQGKALRIVDDLSLSLRRGETLGLVGESGSGKSTVANAILRLLPQRARGRITGRIRLGETELTSLPEPAMRAIRGRRIAMIPQDPMSSLNPLFTVGAQIAEALAAHGMRRSRSAVRAAVVDLLARVRIDAPATRIDQYPHELSGGMRQRVVGAIAMASAPEFLLADEPTTALDVTVQAQYLDMLADLQRDTALGLLFITHDLGVVARICTRVAVMYAGRIVESGPVERLFADPQHWYTRALLDSLPGTVASRARLAAIPGVPLRPGSDIAGCRFAPRCPAARDACRRAEPALEAMAPAPDHAGSLAGESARAESGRGDPPPADQERQVRCLFPVGLRAKS
jgi:oligopeptide/dipeptide ABC transporter ATP-binding protein